MKTKKFILNDNLIKIDNYYYGVDKDDEIKENEWFVGDNLKQVIKYDDGFSKIRKGFKVIFSTNPNLKILPYLLINKDDFNIKSIEVEYYEDKSIMEHKSWKYIDNYTGYKGKASTKGIAIPEKWLWKLNTNSFNQIIPVFINY